MIRFSLHCDRAHEFEAWFASNADFDVQKERGLVGCPACGSTEVSKALMAPSVARRKEKAGEAQPGHALALDPKKAEMMKTISEMVRQVRAHSEDVGERFPEEARKIHYGEAEARGIIGKANSEEARALIEEGVGIAPLPEIPDDRN